MQERMILKKNMIIQYCRKNTLYGSEDHLVWKSENHGLDWQELCRLPPQKHDIIARCRDYLLRSRPVRRWRRNIGINNVVVLPTGTAVIQYDRIYRYDGHGNRAQPVFDLQQAGVDGPLKNGLCYDHASNSLYFGEYRCRRAGPVRIFRGRDDGRTWSECYRFSPNRIRHIHSITSDPYSGRLYVCTGDADHECGLFYTDDEFRTLHCLGSGDQGWRMVSLLPVGGELVWGSDAGGDTPPGTDNFIYHCNPKTGKRTRLAKVENPVYFSCRTKNGYWLATGFEPHKQGSSSPQFGLWFSANGLDWQPSRHFHYQNGFTGTGSRYGLVYLPGGRSDRLHASPVNCRNFHFSTISIDPPQ